MKKTFNIKSARISRRLLLGFVYIPGADESGVGPAPAFQVDGLPDGFSLEACGEPGFGTTRREESIDARFLRGHNHCGGGGLVGFNGDTVVKK